MPSHFVRVAGHTEHSLVASCLRSRLRARTSTPEAAERKRPARAATSAEKIDIQPNSTDMSTRSCQPSSCSIVPAHVPPATPAPGALRANVQACRRKLSQLDSAHLEQMSCRRGPRLPGAASRGARVAPSPQPPPMLPKSGPSHLAFRKSTRRCSCAPAAWSSPRRCRSRVQDSPNRAP
eukprot:2684235-Pleurochrysis_carterae.AAC.1